MKKTNKFYFVGAALVFLSILVSLACLITVVAQVPGSFEITMAGDDGPLANILIPVAILVIVILVVYLSIGALILKTRKIEIVKYLLATLGIVLNSDIIYSPINLFSWIFPERFNAIHMVNFYYILSFLMYFWLLLASFVSAMFLQKIRENLS